LESGFPFTATSIHSGVDIAKSAARCEATRTASCVRDWGSGYGRLVSSTRMILTYYGHNSVLKVKRQLVRRGQVVALMGSTDFHGNHTHYEVWQNGRRRPWRS